MQFLNWLDDRTGCKRIVREALYEPIPGGARWRYIWGSTLVFTFFVQMITGFFLWTAYSPSTLTAWESVYYIQNVMTGGWLLRGIHHVTAQMMILLMLIHVFQVVIDRAYKAPREINFWLGLVLMKIVLALSLTGYLLPWDQKGYYGTKVATEIAGTIPLFGESVQQLLVGGSEYGHHTLTRFFALHAGLLPALLVLFLVMHVALFRRHRLKAKKPYKRPDAYFWPDQILKDAIACLAVLAVILASTVFHTSETPVAPGEIAHRGAELGAPADPAVEYSAARPEWYFLFLFQFLKYFNGDKQIYGSLIFPGIAMTLLFLMPIVGRWRLGHRFNVSLLIGLALGAAFLTGKAMYADNVEPADPTSKAYQHWRTYQESKSYEEWKGRRAVQLAQAPDGIPARGAVELMRQDPKTQGALVFKTYCASCHTHTAPNVEFVPGHEFVTETQIASNLYRFGSYKWTRSLLDPTKIVTSDYFGAMAAHADGEMVGFVTKDMDIDDADVDIIARALAADAARPDDPLASADVIEAGRVAIVENCIDCHKYGDEGDLGMAPDLTDYGSRQWLIDFVSNPKHERFYQGVDESLNPMPAYRQDPADPTKNTLRQQDIELVVDFLRGEWYEPSPAPTVGADSQSEKALADNADSTQEAAKSSGSAQPAAKAQ